MKKWNFSIFIVLFAVICIGVVNAGDNGYVVSGVSGESTHYCWFSMAGL